MLPVVYLLKVGQNLSVICLLQPDIAQPISSSNRVSQLQAIEHAVDTCRRHQQCLTQVSRSTDFITSARYSSTLGKLPGSIGENGEQPKLLLRNAGCSTPHPGILKGRPPACLCAACCTACWHTACLCTACFHAACLCTACCVLHVVLHVVYSILYCVFV